MKKFRFLAAMVITVVMLFTVAYAADISFDAIEYNGTDDTVTVVVRANSDMEIEQFSAYAFEYDQAVYTVASMTSSYAAAELTDMGGIVSWANGATTTIAKDADLLTVVFNVTNKDAVVGTTFATNEDNSLVMVPVTYDFYDVAASVTVTAAAPVVEYETVDLIGEAIAADTTSVADYTNYAIYANDFTAPADVEKVNALGFKVETKDDVTFDAAITGTVKYIVAYVGEGAADAVVKPFYNVTRVK